MAQELRPPSASPMYPASDDSSPLSATSGPATRDAQGPAADDTGAVPLTRSIPSATSSSSAQAPRSRPSVPHVGIPYSLRKWERFEVLELLGAGGMGAVYKARDPRLSRMIALKVVHPRLGEAPGSTGQYFARSFMREARLQASLEHPHICKVYEIGELPNRDEEAEYPYIAMQLISGQPLNRARLHMSLLEKVRVVKQVAEALHAAHRQGLIHRDIKPSNIMIERTEEGKFHPYVMDFGLARETKGSDHSRSGVIEGTPRYMSPEQARGDVKLLDRRTDVYALGVTLYELLGGRSPYDEGTGEMDLLLAVLTAEPKPLRTIDPNIPIDLEAVTLKCLEKEPSARYDSAKALADDLERYLDGEPVQARHIGLGQRLYRRVRKHKTLVALGGALLLTILGLISYGVRTRLVTLDRERQAKQQAELAQKLGQRLGQEITKMEWLLRSARQLPLHDLGREKVIIRSRMDLLQSDLANYGELGRGLAHYALGRGHMALHEYPQALSQLQLAISLGNQSADVHYALGFVLGKHYEQAMYEARLSGGGDWANKQLMELEPKYLTPAIASLVRSRAMRSDAPEYLEALIAYYQRDYELALKKSEVAQREAPWLYEAPKLRGDIHLEQALHARDSGKNPEAEQEFAAAVKSYNEAAEVGQSDAEVYEGLAEAWVRQIETALTRGQPTEAAYSAAVIASDKLTAADPQSVAGRLKKGYAALMTMALTGAGLSSAERIRKCLTEAQAVLDKEPENPYASDVAAGCNAFAAYSAQERGEDPEPLLRKALGLLEPAMRRYPHFLWGMNDLANLYVTLGAYFQTRGNPATKELFEKSIKYESLAVSLDATYLMALQNLLFISAKFLTVTSTEDELRAALTRADAIFSQCMQANNQFLQCHVNYVAVYAQAAQRTYLAGADPQPRLQRALTALAAARKFGGSFLDAEQNAVLVHWVDASERVRKKQTPEPALKELQAALTRCFAIAASDAMCRTLAAQSEWITSDWLSVHNSSPTPALKRALAKALWATQSPETYPDSWQVLAQTYLRLAQSVGNKPTVRDLYLQSGLAATAKIFSINPNHALGHATQGSLLLRRAQTLHDPSARRADALSAATSLTQAIKLDASLAFNYAALLSQAQDLTSEK